MVESIEDWDFENVIAFAKSKRREELQNFTLAELKKQWQELIN